MNYLARVGLDKQQAGLDMRKTHIAICAIAALGLCLMVPKGASAFPAADSAGKAYTQTVTGKSAAVQVYLRRAHWGGRGWGWRRAAWRGGWGWRGAAWRRGYYGGWGWRRAAWRRGYYGGWGRYGGGWPVGLGLGIAAAGSPYYGGYYGGYYPSYYRGCGCY